MPTTPHSPTTWRDLADQLTPEQVAEIEYCEREQIPPGIASEQGRINQARGFIEFNLAQSLFADIAPPADCIGQPTGWLEWDHGVWNRSYVAWERQAAGSRVQVVGYQYGDGRPVERVILHEDTDNTDELTPARARVLACLLHEAAELVDKLAGGDR